MNDTKYCPHCGTPTLLPEQNPNEGTYLYVACETDTSTEYFSDAQYYRCSSCERYTFLSEDDETTTTMEDDINAMLERFGITGGFTLKEGDDDV